MAFTKYTQAEKAEVVDPKGHKAASAALKKIGKTSMNDDLTEEERKAVTKSIDSA